MGQKTHPRGLRLGIIEGWDSKWFASHDYAPLLHEDLKLRDFIKRRLYHGGMSKIEIERMANKAKVNIHTARPGIVIGKKGVEIDKLKADIQKMMKGKDTFINIHEVRRPDLDPQLVAENIALQLERRVAFRRAMKEAVTRAMRMGAQGRPRRADPAYQALRPCIDSRVSGQAVYQKARRDPDGQGQGLTGRMDRGGQARANPVRNGRRRSGYRARGDAPCRAQVADQN